MRNKRIIWNGAAAIVRQFVTIAYGLIVPQLLIRQFGSAIYGATTSASQFLSYISLAESGIGAIGRAALYKPLAENDMQKTSDVLGEFQHFYRGLAICFAGYALLLACVYNYIVKDSSLSWSFSFCLVLVMAISTLVEYCMGEVVNVLLQADQRSYIQAGANCISQILNVILLYILILHDNNILVVKLVGSSVFLLRILLLKFYVKRRYSLPVIRYKGKKYLQQRKAAFGQHIAYFLHSKTDIVLLTIFIGLQEVAVYSVYNYITASISGIIAAAVSGMEAAFGELLAKNEKQALKTLFKRMEFLVNTISVILFSTALVLFIPFVKLYTAGIEDANYFRPVVAFFMIIAQMLYAVRLPYNALITAAGHFEQTEKYAYMEAGLNIALSLLLVHLMGMEGVVLATAISVLYRAVCFAYYLSKHVVCFPVRDWIKRISISFGIVVVVIITMQTKLLRSVTINNYFEWVVFGCIIFLFISTITFGVSLKVYKEDMKWLSEKINKMFVTKRKAQY